MTQLKPEDIADLQSKLAFQEDELEKMNDALYNQQLRMDALEQKLEQLSEQYEELADQTPDGATTVQEKPPHY